MTTAIICDDEPRLAEALRDMLKTAWPELDVVALAHNGGDALALIADHEPNVAFLDVRMPGLSGIDVARQITGGTSSPQIVFVTAFDEHAIAAFDIHAVDYLLKPVRAERLAETVARLKGAHRRPPQIDQAWVDSLRQLAGTERKYLRWLNCGQGSDIDVIATSEVLFFQSRDKYTAVITADKERYIRTPMRELLNVLDPDEFWQVHRSSVIQVAAIERVMRDDVGRMQVKMRGNSELVPVSAAFSGRFKQM